MIEKKIIKELKRKLGKNKVFEELEYQITYSYDATGIELLPDLVVFPENDQDIETILKIAYQHKIPVTPRGAGVGYTGGSIPVQKGIVMVFTRMNRILSISRRPIIRSPRFSSRFIHHLLLPDRHRGNRVPAADPK